MPARPARIAALALLAAALTAGASASAAQAKASIVLDPGCYLSGEQGSLVGSGFRADSSWTATLSGTTPLGSGRTDGGGRIRARFTAPDYDGTNGTRELTLTVSDGPNVASTRFLMSPLAASFSPETGDPATLKVRWRVLGIGARRGVYVHYVRPDGRLQRSVKIGTSDPVCGALKTRPIALFPFRYAFGVWRFQVDTALRWSPRTTPRLLIRFEVRRPSRARRRQTKR